jgi:hypothetical protein
MLPKYYFHVIMQDLTIIKEMNIIPIKEEDFSNEKEITYLYT